MTKPTPHYSPFGSLIPNRSWSDASRVYRYGFNGKEKDFETSSDNYDFGARIYDGRLGRWLRVDNIYHFNQSNYSALKCSPISIIDPSGNTDYYNMAGDWIGTDGVDNGIKQVVTDRKIVKQITKSSLKGNNYTSQLPNGSFFQLPNKSIIDAIIALEVFSSTDQVTNGKVTKEGGTFEAGTTFDANGVQTPIVSGQSVGPLQSSAHVPLPESGTVSIHTHPTVYFNLITGERKSYTAERSSSDEGKDNNDEGLFKGYNLNIVIGYDVLSSQVQVHMPGGETRVVDNVRTLIVNFYDSARKLFTITYEALVKINNGNSGKYKEKYDKKRKKI